MKLIFFSHANRIKRVGKIDDCDDREWKISPRRGDGNVFATPPFKLMIENGREVPKEGTEINFFISLAIFRL